MGAGRDDVMTAVVPTDEQVRDAISSASANWRNWRPCWEHEGDWREHPLLATQLWFGCFVWEYGLGRTFARNRACDLRAALRESQEFCAAVEHGDETQLERAAVTIPKRLYGLNEQDDVPRRLTSLTSKVATFIRPSAFMAWDTQATAGLRSLTKGLGLDAAPSLAPYQRRARSVASSRIALSWWDASLPAIDAEADTIGAKRLAFRLRVLDWVAMAIGSKGVFYSDAFVPDFHQPSKTRDAKRDHP